MATPGRMRRAPFSGCRELRPLPVDMLDQPLEYFFAEHFRHRCLCALLRNLADEPHCARDVADRIAVFMRDELPRHHGDEDDILFPLVLLRAVPEDGLAPVIERLAADHRRAQRQAHRIIEGLSSDPAGPAAITPRLAELMRSYARAEHRHLAVENGIVLVIARKRLKPADLAAIARGMRIRRGLQG
jgi:hemerythrin-like domain-containing protein